MSDYQSGLDLLSKSVNSRLSGVVEARSNTTSRMYEFVWYPAGYATKFTYAISFNSIYSLSPGMIVERVVESLLASLSKYEDSFDSFYGRVKIAGIDPGSVRSSIGSGASIRTDRGQIIGRVESSETSLSNYSLYGDMQEVVVKLTLRCNRQDITEILTQDRIAIDMSNETIAKKILSAPSVDPEVLADQFEKSDMKKIVKKIVNEAPKKMTADFEKLEKIISAVPKDTFDWNSIKEFKSPDSTSGLVEALNSEKIQFPNPEPWISDAPPRGVDVLGVKEDSVSPSIPAVPPILTEALEPDEPFSIAEFIEEIGTV
jgi:hypothetical protein